jgi:hypothetical protein
MHILIFIFWVVIGNYFLKKILKGWRIWIGQRLSQVKWLIRFSFIYNEIIRMPIDMVWYAYHLLFPKLYFNDYFKTLTEQNKDVWKLHPLALWWFEERYKLDLDTAIQMPVMLTAYIGKIIASFFWIIFLLCFRLLFNIFIRYSHILWLLHFYFYLLIRIILWLKWIISPKMYYELWVILSKIDSLCAIYWLQDLTVVILRTFSKIKPVEVTHLNVDTYKTSPPKHSSWITIFMSYTEKIRIFSLLNISNVIKNGFIKSFFWSFFFWSLSGVFYLLNFIQIELKSCILIINIFI